MKCHCFRTAPNSPSKQRGSGSSISGCGTVNETGAVQKLRVPHCVGRRRRRCRSGTVQWPRSRPDTTSRLHLRSIEEPQSRMPTEQGGTVGLDATLGSRAGVPLPLQLPPHSNLHHHHPQHNLHHSHHHANSSSSSSSHHAHSTSNHHHHHHHHHHHQQQQTGTQTGSSATGAQGGTPQQGGGSGIGYDAEFARMESWLDENPEFVQDYFIRKATRNMVDGWLVSHATPVTTAANSVDSPTHGSNQPSSSRGGSGATTPVRKISAHEFERGGLLKPIVNTIDGTPTFLSISPQNESSASGSIQCCPNGVAYCGANLRPLRLSRNELKQLDERELIFELVKDICNDLDVRSLCHKILQNVSILLNADRGSLFLVQGKSTCGGDNTKKCLVSKLFDVCSNSTLEEMEQQDEVKVAWGTGIAGHVAESGEPVNIPDAYQVSTVSKANSR
uniref:GAF domain-containing protein n=1 Tax=Anopheles culicifacies TaxID=139723 RepID=A0A182MGZ5_9DIPT